MERQPLHRLQRLPAFRKRRQIRRAPRVRPCVQWKLRRARLRAWGSDLASLSTTVAGAPFEVTVRAKDRARVEIKSDGKVVVRGVIEPSEVKTIHATNTVVFWTANAGQVELSFNGKNVPLNGGENDEQVLVFNSHGLFPRSAAQ